MMFFFKRKIIHLDCFTTESSVYELFPVDYSHKFYPDWWKKLPKQVNIPESQDTNNLNIGFVPTMKSCIGFTEFYQNSITIPMWTDMLIKVNKEKNYYDTFFSDTKTKINKHFPRQMEGLIDTQDYLHFKIDSPWFFSCKNDVRFSWTQPSWNFNPIDKIVIPPAIIDYKYQIGTNINFFGKYVAENTKKDILIEAGQPMVNIIPLSERKLKFHNHLIGEDEYNKIVMPYKTQNTFHSVYNSRKKFLDKKETKCPFGF